MEERAWASGESRRAFLGAIAGGAAGLALAGGRAAAPAAGGKVMRTIVSEGLGRIVILGFDRGEKLREGIRDRLKELGIRNAVLVSAIGTLEKARFHRIKHTLPKPEDEILEVEGPIELSSVEGLVADGEPHLHMTFGDLGKAYSAHLEDGSVVCYLAEVVLAEMKGVDLVRTPDENGIRLLRSRSEAGR